MNIFSSVKAGSFIYDGKKIPAWTRVNGDLGIELGLRNDLYLEQILITGDFYLRFSKPRTVNLKNVTVLGDIIFSSLHCSYNIKFEDVWIGNELMLLENIKVRNHIKLIRTHIGICTVNWKIRKKTLSNTNLILPPRLENK